MQEKFLCIFLKRKSLDAHNTILKNFARKPLNWIDPECAKKRNVIRILYCKAMQPMKL